MSAFEDALLEASNTAPLLAQLTPLQQVTIERPGGDVTTAADQALAEHTAARLCLTRWLAKTDSRFGNETAVRYQYAQGCVFVFGH